MEVNKWDRRFLELARLVSTWSKDPVTQVGCVLVQGRKVIATGYNGFPAGIEDLPERLDDRETKLRLVVHAEMNAILQAGKDAEGSTLYLWFPYGGVPCGNCTKHIISAGIRHVVTQDLPPNPRWAEEQGKAEEVLTEAGVSVKKL